MIKPILFNTYMVFSILVGRKTVTRRVVKFPRGWNPKFTGYIPDGAVLYGSNNIPAAKAPYQPGDILWVRETWQIKRGGGYLYKANMAAPFDLFITPEGKVVGNIPWRPAIHMPREAARIFLRVTDVRVERLQKVSGEDIRAEGVLGRNFQAPTRGAFADMWNRTIKPKDRNIYGWEANPWVWVIMFERVGKEEVGI